MRWARGGPPPRRWPLDVLLALNPDPQAHALRRRLLDTIHEYPGLHLRELARMTDLSAQHAQYHLRVLEKVGAIASVRERQQVRFYLTQATPVGDLPTIGARDRELLELLRRPATLQILVRLLLDGPLTLSSLARKCGVTPATTYHHLERIQRLGVVGRSPDAPPPRWSLVEPERIRSLLVQHQPPPRLVEGFLEAWQRLGP